MQAYNIHVKNLNCPHCMQEVNKALNKHNIQVNSMMNGEIVLSEKPSRFKLKKIRVVLRNYGMELIVSKEEKIVEKIKSVIKDLIDNSKDKPLKNLKISEYIAKSKEISPCYSYISNIFSSYEPTTIEKYFISQRIEHVKELLIENELSLSQIANQLGYSSVHYLSNQFKKQTGMTPTSFKKSIKN